MTVNDSKCTACGTLRPLAELLIVRHRRDGVERYVCRPSYTPASCFRTVRSALFESIEIADRDAWDRAAAVDRGFPTRTPAMKRDTR